MSAKQSKRLRRIAELETKKEMTDVEYVKVPVLAARANWMEKHMREQVVLDKKSARAYYQKAKQMIKSGEAKAEADRIEKAYKDDQRRIAKEYAKTIEDIVENKGKYQATPDPVLGSAEVIAESFVQADRFIDQMRDWLIYHDKPELFRFLATANPYTYQVLLGEREIELEILATSEGFKLATPERSIAKELPHGLNYNWKDEEELGSWGVLYESLVVFFGEVQA